MIEQAKFTNSPLGKACQKQSKTKKEKDSPVFLKQKEIFKDIKIKQIS